MADSVQTRLEKNIKHYDLLKKSGIMDDEEISEIIKKREYYVNLLERPKKEIKHYLEYITYERNLLRTAIERKGNRLEASVENALLRRIQTIYIQATSHFPNFDRLWDEYISFMGRSKFPDEDIMAVYEQMLQFHGHMPEQWLKVIKWQRHVIDRDQIKIYKPCEDFLLRAIRRHPTDTPIKLELFDLELKNYGQQPSCTVEKRCIALYTNDKSNLLQVDILILLLEQITKFKATEDFQRCILSDLKTNFCTEEAFWKTIAQRELNGQLTYSNPGAPDVDKATLSLKTRILVFVKVYRTGIELINSKSIWSLFLDDLVALIVHEENLIRFKRKLLGQSYKEAEEASKLEERHYIQYIKLLIGTLADHSVIEHVFTRSTTMYPESVQLWRDCMSFHMENEDVSKVTDIFTLARKKLACKAHPLWDYYIGFLQLMGKTELLYKTYDLMMREQSPHFSELKAQYLEYIALLYGVKHVRQLFKGSLKMSNTILPLEMYNKMLEIESLQITPNVEEWRGVLEHAITAFGKKEIDIWTKYIDFEMQHGDPLRAAEITDRAERTLDDNLLEHFKRAKLLARLVKDPL